ncbi:hypothetical protein Pcar_3466 [Syntrophotalea carbinolica DSM 2380]|uniref:Uncharacterized protein n=1 Tax=Syntrophotalea carbinolica (strain DSM 2380 / NBRC 103641 / GraBd1) TaxID=338963 RepID=J9UI67_SYNC1|nr:hypothetical protein Pcar_3466 [Syntrophotalea carbinolica DSM 2380]
MKGADLPFCTRFNHLPQKGSIYYPPERPKVAILGILFLARPLQYNKSEST